MSRGVTCRVATVGCSRARAPTAQPLLPGPRMRSAYKCTAPEHSEWVRGYGTPANGPTPGGCWAHKHCRATAAEGSWTSFKFEKNIISQSGSLPSTDQQQRDGETPWLHVFTQLEAVKWLLCKGQCGAGRYRDEVEKVPSLRSSHSRDGDKVKKRKQFKILNSQRNVSSALGVESRERMILLEGWGEQWEGFTEKLHLN